MIIEKTNNRGLLVAILQSWALGVAVVIGGQFFSFNIGYAAGFGSFMIITVLMGFAFITFSFSMAETISGLPFAGGAYGLARMSLGFYPGFLIGCLESLEYIFFVSTAMQSLAMMLVYSYGLEEKMLLILPLVGYVFAIFTHLAGLKFFWAYTNIIAWGSVILLLVYCFGSLPYVDFQNAAFPIDPTTQTTMDKYFIGGGKQYMSSFEVASWMYIGIESIGFLNDTVEHPTKSIPIAYVSAMITLFLLSIFLLFVCASLPPNIIDAAMALTPLNTGYMLMFNIPYEHATLISIPAIYSTASGFIFPFSKLLVSLSHSNLFPHFLKRTTSENVPYAAILFGCTLGYAMCILCYYYPDLLMKVFSICTLSTFIIYISQCIGYIRFKTVYVNIKREFVSPFGVAGAVYSICIFAVGAISSAAFQQDTSFAVIVIAVFLAAASIYYYLVVKDTQIFSEEETKVMYLCHMINHHLQEKHHDLDSHGRIPVPKDEDLQSMRSTSSYQIAHSRISNASACFTPKSAYVKIAPLDITPTNSSGVLEITAQKFIFDDSMPVIDELNESIKL